MNSNTQRAAHVAASARTQRIAMEAVPAAGSDYVGSPGWLLEEFQRLIEQSPGQVALLIRDGDRIIIRDNSGVTGLTGEPLMQKSIALLDELFPSQNNQDHGAPRTADSSNQD